MTLWNNQIDKYYKNQVRYGGCISNDELGKKKGDKFYIVNLENHNLDGTHWVLVYNVDPDCIIYFDSFGQPPTESVKKYIKKIHSTGKKAFYSKLDLQAINSDMCGEFCIYVADHLLKGDKFNDILEKQFTKSVEENDLILKKYFKENK